MSEFDGVLEVKEQLTSVGWADDGILRNFSVRSLDVLWQADFLLLYQLNPLALVDLVSPSDGVDAYRQRGMWMQRAATAHAAGVPFALFKGGDRTWEIEGATGEVHERTTLPTPKELWTRLHGDEPPLDNDPRLFPPAPVGTLNRRTPAPHQIFALSRTLDALARGQRQALVLMATGTGVSWVQSQLAWKLLRSGYCHRLLYLTDRRPLGDLHTHPIVQAFGEEARVGSIERILDHLEQEITSEVPSIRVYSAVVPLVDLQEDMAKLRACMSQVPPDFFDLIFLDSGIGFSHLGLEMVSDYNVNAQVIGFYPNTVREEIRRSTNAPVFEFSIAQALAAEEPKVPPGYHAVCLGDIAEFRHGTFIKRDILEQAHLEPSAPDTPDNPEPLALLVSARDVRSDGSLDFTKARKLPIHTLIEVTSISLGGSKQLDPGVLLQPNDLVLVAAGRTGSVALVSAEVPNPVILGSSLLRVRLTQPSQAHDVYKFLKSDAGQAALSRIIVGTTQARLTVSALKGLQIFLPEQERAEEQVAIGSNGAPAYDPNDNSVSESSSGAAVGSLNEGTEPSPEVDISRAEAPQDPRLTAAAAAQRRINDDILPLLNEVAGNGQVMAADPDRLSLASALLRDVANLLTPPGLAERVTSSYPAPIALAYQRFQDGRFNVYETVLRLRDLAEATSFFLYNVLLADALRNLDPQRYFITDAGARRAYNHYSMAARLGFVSTLLDTARENASDLFMPELVDVSDVVGIARTLQDDLRNRISHTAASSESQQLRLIDEFKPEVDFLLSRLDFLRNYRLVRVPSFYYRHGQLIRQMIVYNGTVPTLDEQSIENDALSPVERDHLVLLNTDEQVLDLYPIYQLFSGQETRHETHLCVLKQCKKSAQRLEGESVSGAFPVELDGYAEFEALQNRLLDKLPS
jgi:hypothetical protein